MVKRVNKKDSSALKTKKITDFIFGICLIGIYSLIVFLIPGGKTGEIISYVYLFLFFFIFLLSIIYVYRNKRRRYIFYGIIVGWLLTVIILVVRIYWFHKVTGY